MENTVHICMISDDNFLLPTSVAIQSMINAKDSAGSYCVHIIASALGGEAKSRLKQLETQDVSIEIIEDNAEKRFQNYHTFDSGSACAASIAALFKFMIPDLLGQLDKVLYLDGDIVVNTDLSALFSTPLTEEYAAAVVDSGSIYLKENAWVGRVQNYFNSGVMVLNLAKIRKANAVERLLAEKKALDDASLMDQNVFNLVFDGHVKFLPIAYNFMAVNMLRSDAHWSIDDVNRLYGTEYQNKKELYRGAKIIHYASKDKPWKKPDCALAYKWTEAYLRTPGEHSLLPPRESAKYEYAVSVIIPCYNTEKYVAAALSSIYAQTFQNFEVICLDDASQDSTLKTLTAYAAGKSNMTVAPNAHKGPGRERNCGIKMAKGKYIYYMDSDDLLAPAALETLYKYAEQNRADVVFFEGESFYESPALEEKYPVCKKELQRKNAYPKIYAGRELYCRLQKGRDYNCNVALQFVKRDFLLENNICFPEMDMLEDSIYTLELTLQAGRAMVLPQAFYKRRVREHSIMTAAAENPAAGLKNLVLCEKHIAGLILRYRGDSELAIYLNNHLAGYFRQIEAYGAAGTEALDEKTGDMVLLSRAVLSEIDCFTARQEELNERLADIREQNRENGRMRGLWYDKYSKAQAKLKKMSAKLDLLRAENAENAKALKQLSATAKRRGAELEKLKKENEKIKSSRAYRLASRLASPIKKLRKK